MHERSEQTALPTDVREAARSAASSEAAAARIAELEQLLATERSHNAVRIREIDAAMRILRKSMQDLQSEIRRGTTERDRLREQLDQSRRNLAAITTDTGPGETEGPDPELLARIEALESELGETRADADAARLVCEDFQSREAGLKDEILRRDESLGDLRARLATADLRVEELSENLRARSATPAPGARAASDSTDDLMSAGADAEEPNALVFDTCDSASVEAPVSRSHRASANLHTLMSAPANYAESVCNEDSMSIGLDDIEPFAIEAFAIEPFALPGATPASPSLQAPAPSRAANAPAPHLSPHSGHALSSGPELLDDSRSVPAEVAAAAPSGSVAPRHSSHGPSVSQPSDADRPATPLHAESSQDPEFPEIPGHRLERLIDDGPLGRAYEARESATRRPVIVRVLPSALKHLDGKRLDSLLLAKHPNLVGVLSFAVSRTGPYLVMERAEGESVDTWVRRVGPLPEPIALAVALECARGLRQAAFHGALHLELAPEAIFVDAAGKVRVGGVGLRSVLHPGDASARHAAFAAPERLRDGAASDLRSDIYSLGAVIFYLLAGRPPFAGSRDEIARLQAVGAPDIRETRPDVTADTAKLVTRILSMDADMRHPTWDQVLVDLERRLPGQKSPELSGNLHDRIRRFAVLHPWTVPAAITTLLAIAIITRIALAEDETAADRFRVIKARVAAMAAKGDTESARELLRPFLRNAGDPQVERDAARLFDELPAAPK